MDGKHGEVMGARVSPVLQIVPLQKILHSELCLLVQNMYVHRKGKARKRKRKWDCERAYKFSLSPFFSSSLCPVWDCHTGDPLVGIKSSRRQHEEENGVKKWKKPPSLLFHFPLHCPVYSAFYMLFYLLFRHRSVGWVFYGSIYSLTLSKF